jgi:hypothetical protein
LYLLDTNIVSADAPAKREVGPEAFAKWVREHSQRLYLSTVTIAGSKPASPAPTDSAPPRKRSGYAVGLQHWNILR